MSEPTECGDIDQLVEETAIWCATKSPFQSFRDCFRSIEFQPEIAAFPDPTDLDRLVTAVRFVASKRSELVRGISIQRPGGHLMVCEFNRSIWSGESEAATQGFFDVGDRPPWDTWICAIGVPLYRDDVETLLVSWVPEPLFEVVNEGIDANPYGCIYWLRSAPSVVRGVPIMERLLGASER